MNIIDYLVNLLNKLLRKQSKSPVTYTSNSTNITKSTNNTKTNSIGEYKLTTQDLTMRKGDGHTFNATLTINGKPSVNSTIIYTINNKEYNRKTDNNGVTMLPINLNQGKYVITTTYNDIHNVNTIIVNDTPSQPEVKTNTPPKSENKTPTQPTTQTKPQPKHVKGLFIRPSDTGKLSFVELKNKGYTHLFIGHMIFDDRGDDYVRKLHDKCKIIGAKLIIWYTTYYNGSNIVTATSSEADKRIQTIINIGKKDIVDGVCLDYCRNNGDTVNNTIMNRISDNVNKVVKSLNGKEVYACTMFESIPALKQYYRQDISKWNCTICPMAYKYNYNYSDNKMKSMYNEFKKTNKKIIPIYQNYRGDNNITDIGQGQLSKDIKAVGSDDYIIFRYGTGSY